MNNQIHKDLSATFKILNIYETIMADTSLVTIDNIFILYILINYLLLYFNLDNLDFAVLI